MIKLPLNEDPFEVFCSLSEKAEKGFFCDRWGTGRYSLMGFDPVVFYEGNAEAWKGFLHNSTVGAEKEFWFGLMGYDLALAMEKLPPKSSNGLGLPDFQFGHYKKWARADHQEKCWELFGDWCVEEIGSLKKVNLAGRAFERRDLIDAKAYGAWVEKCRKWIYEGDIFQANLSHPIFYQCEGHPLGLYKRMREFNPSPYAGVFFDRSRDFWLLSNSPELLFEVQGNVVKTKPIAGTRRRGKTEAEEARFIAELKEIAKEQAEHLMLVDLERNDLGRVCEYGSVHVPEFGAVEAYQNVFHLVSTVEGTLRKEVSVEELFRALFPGGTITGAPKIRSMEIIAALEKFQRGYYTGSMGYLYGKENMDFNILIRTAQWLKGEMQLSFGAGIVYDSDPVAEYKETLNKAGAWSEILKEPWG